MASWAVEAWRGLLAADRLAAAGQAALRVLAVLVLLRVAAGLARVAVDRFVAGYKRGPLARGDGARVDTVATLLKSVTRYALYFVGFLWILDAVGIPAASIIAAAGIGGLAIGFGAQHLVRDFISGFFILLEDQYEVGELVTVDGLTGVVGEVGLRSTRLDALSGDLIHIANGSIKVVVNHSRADMRAQVDVTIGYQEDHGRAMEVAQAALDHLRSQVDYIVEGPEVLGVTDLSERGVVLRIWAKAKNMNQWALERQMRRAVKEALDREGIQMPARVADPK